MIRLFVSVELPGEIRERLGALCCDVPGARWSEPDSLHLTVRFIGEVEGHVFEDICDVLGTVRAEPFDLRICGVGHFPPRGAPRMLWAGLGPSEDLGLLRGRVDAALARVGVAPERRRFSPHITLARLRATPTRAVGSFLSTHGRLEAGPFRVDRFWLFSSKLSSRRAVHRVEAEYALGDALL